MISTAQARLADLNAVLIVLALAGLLVHRRYRLSWAFGAYLLAVLLGNRLPQLWPERFFTPRFWNAKELAYAVLKVGIAVELGVLTFARFPRARRIFLGLVAALVAVALVVQLAPSIPQAGEAWASYVNPRGQACVLWFLAGMLALVRYYRVPLHPFHRTLLLGFGLYLGMYVGALSVLRARGAEAYTFYSALDPAAYAATMGIWAWACWRRAPEMSEVARSLQPWAAVSR